MATADGEDVTVEVEFIGDGTHRIRVRTHETLGWDELSPSGNYHPESGYEFAELRALGEGTHTVKKKPRK